MIDCYIYRVYFYVDKVHFGNTIYGRISDHTPEVKSYSKFHVRFRCSWIQKCNYINKLYGQIRVDKNTNIIAIVKIAFVKNFSLSSFNTIGNFDIIAHCLVHDNRQSQLVQPSVKPNADKLIKGTHS